MIPGSHHQCRRCGRLFTMEDRVGAALLTVRTPMGVRTEAACGQDCLSALVEALCLVTA